MKDEERQYDVRVQDCWAFDMESFEDSKTSKVQLTGYDGCPRLAWLMRMGLMDPDSNFVTSLVIP